MVCFFETGFFFVDRAATIGIQTERLAAPHLLRCPGQLGVGVPFVFSSLCLLALLQTHQGLWLSSGQGHLTLVLAIAFHRPGSCSSPHLPQGSYFYSLADGHNICGSLPQLDTSPQPHTQSLMFIWLYFDSCNTQSSAGICKGWFSRTTPSQQVLK